MTESEIELTVSAHCRPRTEPSPPPRIEDWKALEDHFGCKLPEELFHLQSVASRYWIEGEYLPIDEIAATYEQEFASHWDADLIPFYVVGNGDLICVRKSEGQQSRIYYWAHDDPQTQMAHESAEAFLRDPDWFP